MATGGNAQEGAGEKTVGALGEISTADVWGRDPTGGACMGDNGTHTKREGGYRGVVLVEVAWRVCAAVVNCRLKRGVVLLDVLHGFRGVRGT